MFCRIFCRHVYKPWANVYGDLINVLNCRTVMQCPKCGKRVLKKEYLRAPINYNVFIQWAYYTRKFKKTHDLEDQKKADDLVRKVCKDLPLFVENFVGGKLK